MIILEGNFKWHLEAFASELFISSLISNHHAVGVKKCVCVCVVAGCL